MPVRRLHGNSLRCVSALTYHGGASSRMRSVHRLISSHLPLENCITRATRLFPLSETAFRVTPHLALLSIWSTLPPCATLSFYVVLCARSNHSIILEISLAFHYKNIFNARQMQMGKMCARRILKCINGAYAHAIGTDDDAASRFSCSRSSSYNLPYLKDHI